MRHPHHHPRRRVVYRSRTGCLGGCLSLGLLLAIVGGVFALTSAGACAGIFGASSPSHHGRF